MSNPTHPKCGKSYPSGSSAGHCSGNGLVTFPLWPTTGTWANFDTPALEQSPDRGGIGVESLADYLRSVTEIVKAYGFIPVDTSELVLGVSAAPILAMLSGVFLSRKNAEVARVIVGSVAVDVMDVLAVFRASDNTVLVCLDVLAGGYPTKSDVAPAGDVRSGNRARWFLSSTEHPNWLPIRAKARLAAGVTPPALTGGSGNDGLAIDADNVHTLSIQWFCCETFIGLGAFEAHRRGEHGVDRRCEITANHWTDDRGYWHVGAKLTDEQKTKMWGPKE